MAKGITVVWVPGAWHGPEGFDESAGIVASKGGYENSFVNLPSVGKALKDPYEDSIEIKRIILEELDNKGNDVVLITHSYGGVCGSNACEGLSKEERSGKDTAVIGTVYLAAFCVGQGVSLWNAIGNQDLPWFEVKGDLVDPKTPDAVFYNACSEGQKVQFAKSLKSQSYNVFQQPMKYEVWKHVPSTYLVCELDQAIPAAGQRGLIEAAGTFKEVKAIDSDHSPFLCKPEETAEFILSSIDKHFK